MLIKQLPRDSALNRELHGEAADWSVTDHLLAAVVDHLAAANWMFASVNSGEGEQPEYPEPVPRPVDAAEETDGDGDEDRDEDGAARTSAATGRRATARPARSEPRSTDPASGSPSAVQLARFFG
ncbi:hypothetical protein ACIHEJ_25215 [Streptomyces sp. NPDC052301]|uniref:hypothetical protein n=1 Tax=Streptomyces sp. NPDC052301 TaxID=3365687 RepID=UPI0037D241C8